MKLPKETWLEIASHLDIPSLGVMASALKWFELTSYNWEEYMNNKEYIHMKDERGLKGLELIKCYVKTMRDIERIKGTEYPIDVNYFSGELIVTCEMIGTIDVTPLVNLTFLELDQIHISSIDVTPLTKLEFLYLDNNSLTTLNVTPLVNLVGLTLFNNDLTHLDVSTLVKLTSLDLSNNQLTHLDITKIQDHLMHLYVKNNKELELIYEGALHLIDFEEGMDEPLRQLFLDHY